MDIATEEFSHLEIVGATIQMLLTGVNGELKNAADNEEIMKMLDGKGAKEDFIHRALFNPQFCVLSGGGPMVTDSNGVPWTGAYVNANSDLTVDLRSNIAAESRAKIVYEYLLQFTDDEYVKDTLRFLMTREITHFQQFEAALDTIQPNFPPDILQGDPRYSHLYFNMSQGEDTYGPWNDGLSSRLGEKWQDIKDPVEAVKKSGGLQNLEDTTGTSRTIESVQDMNKDLSKIRSAEINDANPKKDMQWSDYPDDINGQCDEVIPQEKYPLV